MATLTAPVKTQLGLEELRSRTRTLGQRHRTVLLLVDGRRALSEVLSLAQQAGAQTSHFEDLVRMGMVELPEVAIAAEPRETTPGAFDALRVTSVELEVSAIERPSEFGLDGLDRADTAASQARQRFDDNPVADRLADGAIADELVAPPSHLQGVPGAITEPTTPPSPDSPLVQAAKPVVPPVPAAHGHPATNEQVPRVAGKQPAPVPSLHAPSPGTTLRARQVSLTADARPATESIAPPAHPVGRTSVAQGRAETPRAGHEVANPRRAPLAAEPVARAPAARSTQQPSGAVPVHFPSPAVRTAPPVPAPRISPPGTRQAAPPEAMKSAPTLPIGAVSPPQTKPPATIRRTVLGRLASPRAGSLRIPDEDDARKLERVRELLVETLRLDAPLFGMRMLVRLRSAVSADDLVELVWDIERHLISARHSREEMLNLQRAREMLGLGNTVVADDD